MTRAIRLLGVLVMALVAAVVAAVLVAPAGSAQDAEPLEMTIRKADVLPDGTTRVILDLAGPTDGPLASEAFTVTEDGESVGPVDATLASDIADPVPRNLMVAIDLSGSAAGPPLRAALAAVEELATTLTPGGVAVGIVTFSDEAELVLEPTTDADAVTAVLADLEAGGETALHDAVVVSAQALQGRDGLKNILVFSDGGDTSSTAELSGAVNAAGVVGAPVTTVALVTGDFDEAALTTLSTDTGGRLVEVDSVDGLEDAFAAVADDFARLYVLEYPSSGRTGQFTIEVEATTEDDRRASAAMPVINEIRVEDAATPTVVEVPQPGPLGSSAALGIGLTTVFLALFLVLVAAFMPGSDRRVAKTMRAAFGSPPSPGERAEVSAATAALSRRAMRLIESVPKPEGYDERLQLALDRATWPLRSAEFSTLRVLAAIVGAMLGGILLDDLLLGIGLALMAWLVPRVVLVQRVNQRRKAFMEQLPDTLQLLAGSLKAGYGVMQGLTTIVRETEDPTRSEFQRVLTEARLGLPLEDSLTDMADRIDADEFRWVAVAINIQRRVGGNLASLLETVADTMRERAATRRQIDALSAEGRLSAIILVILPFVLGLYMWLTQPEYLGELLFDPLGQAMMAIVIVLMAIGVVWMKNMIEIDV